MNYSEFLFTQLLRAYSDRFNTMEYDILYNFGKYYQVFEGSQYDEGGKGEYECIQNFLKGRTAFTFAQIREAIERDENIYFLTGLEFGVQYLSDVPESKEFAICNILAIEFGLFKLKN